MAVTGWSDIQKQAFLRQQFLAQTQDWARNYPVADRTLVLSDGTPVGRLYVNRNAADRDLRVIDIALLPPFRRHGLGTQIFQGLFTETDALRWSVSLQVELQNPAHRLYVSLGFLPVREVGSRLLMRRPATRPIPRSGKTSFSPGTVTLTKD